MRNIQSLLITILLMLQASTVTFLYFIHSAFQRREDEVASLNERFFELKAECKLREKAPEATEKSTSDAPRRARPQAAGPAPTGEQKKPTEQTRVDPSTLATVWVLPHPPRNKGRFIKFESFTDRIGPGGQEYFVFKEWTGNGFVETVVLSSELRWDVRP